MRVAGAPISWGVCEVPGWGHQLAPDRVLGEVRALGLAATELGPAGFLPGDPREAAGLLDAYGIAAVGGFVPLVLHDRDGDELLARLAPLLDAYAVLGAGTLVLAAVGGQDGYDRRVRLDDGQWRSLLANLDRVAAAAAARGVVATLHPHVGTVVERPDEVHRVLGGCAIRLCLDTGHLLVGGGDPVELAAKAGDRVAHAHLKDVDGALAGAVRRGERGYAEAVRQGMFRPLGQGDLDVAGVVAGLDAAGYRGWYVLEQDTMLDEEPAPGAGPIADVRASLDFLAGLAA
ncbi:MAG TPA: sugar phosphate isomerase/epimerase [Actinomycetes bacterium]